MAARTVSTGNTSAKKKWRRRPAAAAPPSRLNQIARVDLLTELGGVGARLTRAYRQREWVTRPVAPHTTGCGI